MFFLCFWKQGIQKPYQISDREYQGEEKDDYFDKFVNIYMKNCPKLNCWSWHLNWQHAHLNMRALIVSSAKLISQIFVFNLMNRLYIIIITTIIIFNVTVFIVCTFCVAQAKFCAWQVIHSTWTSLSGAVGFALLVELRQMYMGLLQRDRSSSVATTQEHSVHTSTHTWLYMN